jgi:hypothetical protein
MKLKTPTWEYLWPVQRLYHLEIGNYHEIWRNLKHGFCYVPQTNVEKNSAALLSQTQVRIWRGRSVKVQKCYDIRRLLKLSVILQFGGCCEKLYFVYLLAELDTRKCERVVTKMVRVKMEQWRIGWSRDLCFGLALRWRKDNIVA